MTVHTKRALPLIGLLTAVMLFGSDRRWLALALTGIVNRPALELAAVDLLMRLAALFAVAAAVWLISYGLRRQLPLSRR